MQRLYQKFETLLRHTPSDFKRYLYDEISWKSRMIGIIGPRGVGKTTLILQYIRENLNTKNALYVSADDVYFSDNTLYNLAENLHKNAVEHLFIDEIHKYADWSRELKNIYDSFPSLNVVFSGSSVLDILKGSADLSRRSLIYHFQGLSFREYLNLFHGFNFKPFTLLQIINHEANLGEINHPLPYFKDYLQRGYYPFGIENEPDLRLSQIIMQTLEVDLPHFANLSPGTTRKLKRLLSIISESAPFKPNFTKIAAIIGVSRNSLEDYFAYMEKAGLIYQLRAETKGIRALGKVEKVYLDNTNLINALRGDQSNTGNVRETFFCNQMRLKHEVLAAEKVDFKIDVYTFEVGGRNKNKSQIKITENAFLVKDDIEFGYLNELPLWAFGLTY
jgi:predicted AAA+ superfamily ATPase